MNLSGGAPFDPRGVIWAIIVEDHLMMFTYWTSNISALLFWNLF